MPPKNRYGIFPPTKKIPIVLPEASPVTIDSPAIYPIEKLPELLNKIDLDMSKDGLSFKVVRFLLRTNNQLVFAEGGIACESIPAHYQMADSNSLEAECFSAGFAFFDANHKLFVLDNNLDSSDDITSEFGMLQYVVDELIKHKIPLAEEISFSTFINNKREMYELKSSDIYNEYNKANRKEDELSAVPVDLNEGQPREPDVTTSKKSRFSPNRLIGAFGIGGIVAGIVLIAIGVAFPPLLVILAPIGAVLLTAGLIAAGKAIFSAFKKRKTPVVIKEEESNSHSSINKELSKQPSVKIDPMAEINELIKANDLKAAVIVACKNGQLDILKDLIEKEPELLKTKDIFDQTLLHLAITNKQTDMAVFLLSKGIIDFNATSYSGTALELAIRSDQIDLVKLLLGTYKANPGFGLHIAANYVNFPMVEALLHFRLDKNALNDQNDTPLHSLIHAANSLNTEAIKKIISLLATKENINVKDKKGSTPLHIAARHSSLDVIKTLIEEHGADPTIPNQSGQSLQDILKERLNSSVTNYDYSSAAAAKEILEFIKTQPQPPALDSTPRPKM